jgi:hypothetical protein
MMTKRLPRVADSILGEVAEGEHKEDAAEDVNGSTTTDIIRL